LVEPAAASNVLVVADADTVDGAAQARGVDAPGRAIVLCGRDAAALGALAAELTRRTAVFVGDVARDADRRALDELVGEVFGRDA
jgi:NADP-dependent 3-hydroxy acid dehydrogenase YdfG